MLKEGDVAPAFSLENAESKQVSLKDFGGQTVIIYFYPKDNTPGCTIEANDFSSLLDEFAAKNAVVIGISPDSAKSHQGFIQRHSLRHILLSDPDKAIASAYGAYAKKIMFGKEVMGIVRSTFVVKDGTIQKALYNVKVRGHAKKVLELLDSIQK